MAWIIVRPWQVLAVALAAGFTFAACAPSAAPQAQPAKPAAEAPKPAAEPAKPAAQPAKPAAEPVKPAAEPAKPAAQPAKPAAAAPAKTYKLIFANALNPGDPTVDVMADFKKEVEEKSKGQIQVELFPSAQLGNPEQVNEMVKSGAAHMNMASPQYPAKYIPELQVVTLPYLVPSAEAADKALDGALGAELKKMVEDKTDYMILSFEELGFKHVFNRRQEVKALEDLKGMKLRVTDAAVPIRTFQALGASPVGMSGNEVYTAMQTGVIDGAEFPFTVIRSFKSYEVAKFVSTTSHFYEIALSYANKAFIKSLPDDLRKVVMDASDSMAKKERALSRAGQKTARDFIVSQGLKVTDLPASEIQRMQAAVKPVYDYAKQQYGDALVARVLQATGQ